MNKGLVSEGEERRRGGKCVLGGMRLPRNLIMGVRAPTRRGRVGRMVVGGETVKVRVVRVRVSLRWSLEVRSILKRRKFSRAPGVCVTLAYLQLVYFKVPKSPVHAAGTAG